MAKKNGYNKQIRNRGEDIGLSSGGPYDYRPENQFDDKSQERFIMRREVRNVTNEMFREAQRRDERAFERLKAISGEFYAGLDPRRRQEVADSGMIQEDHTQMANLPRQARHFEYPKAGYYSTPYIADSLRGIDNQSDDDGYPTVRFRHPNNPYHE
jgi:hypothetical protein